MSDALVLEKLKEGEVSAAVDVVYRTHSRDLRCYLRHRLYSDDSVEEVFSDVFKTLMTDLAGFRGEAKLKTWLRSVAHHAMIRYFQRERQRRERTRALEAEDDRRPAPENLRATLKQLLIQIYRRLDDEERALVDLWVQGWSWQEVADKSRTTEEAVRKRFTRLMKRINEES